MSEAGASDAGAAPEPPGGALGTKTSRPSAGGIVWCLREQGAGDAVLLLHGTGSSSHTWAPLAGCLKSDCRLLMPDLPGHGGTGLPSSGRLTIERMANAVARLLAVTGVQPRLVIGHSAGAAVLVQMALDGSIEPAAILSLNGAFVPFEGAASHVFGQLARMLALAPLVPRLAAWRLANRAAVERLVTQVGSSLSPRQIDDYVALIRSPKHVSAALRMMANWDLESLSKRMSGLSVPLELIACDNDRAVPVAQAERLLQRLPQARLHRLAGLGHLAHEEDPARLADLLRRLASDNGVTL